MRGKKVDNGKGNGTDNKVLLVEDDESHAALVLRAFEEISPTWNVDHVPNVGDAFKWLELNKINPPHIVISDYRLPDGNGLALARGARTPEEVGFPLIILTGVGSEKLAVQTLKSGAMDYVVKDAEEIRQLPRTAMRAIHEWNLLMERKHIEDELAIYIDDLENDSCDLENFVDKISQDLENSLSSIQDLNTVFLENYADELDDTAQEYLYKLKGATQKIAILIDSLFKFALPVYLDGTLIKAYNAKLEILKEGKDHEIQSNTDS